MELEKKKEKLKEEFEVLRQQWPKLHNTYLTWSTTKRALGDCRQEGRITPVFRVRISLPYLDVNEMDIAIEVLRHECAHVLAMMEGDYGHGETWKKWALLLDATPSYACKVKGLVKPESKYHLVCKNPKCDNKKIYNKHRLRYPRYYCGDCGIPCTITQNW